MVDIPIDSSFGQCRVTMDSFAFFCVELHTVMHDVKSIETCLMRQQCASATWKKKSKNIEIAEFCIHSPQNMWFSSPHWLSAHCSHCSVCMHRPSIYPIFKGKFNTQHYTIYQCCKSQWYIYCRFWKRKINNLTNRTCLLVTHWKFSPIVA